MTGEEAKALVAFYREQLAEDEDNWAAWLREGGLGPWQLLLADVAAKRETIGLYEDAVEFVEMARLRGLAATHYEAAAESYLNVIRVQVVLYADRAGFRDQWRP